MPDINVMLPDGSEQTYFNINTVTYDSANEVGATETFVSEHLIQNQIQSDWNQNDQNAIDFIKNKPIPTITTEDEGKFLSVKNGAISWENVQSSGGSTSGGIAWDDFTNVVVKETDLFVKKTVYGFSSNDDYYGLYTKAFIFPEFGLTLNSTTNSFSINVGEIYVVEWDGVEYETVAFDASSLMPGLIGLGNGSAFGFGGNIDAPFIVGVVNGQGVTFLSLTEQVTSHTIRIYKCEAPKKIIKNELLPNHLQFGKVNDTFTLIDGTYKYSHNDDTGWNSENIPITSDIHLMDGETYTILFDGIEYNCTAFGVPEFNNVICVGNAIISGRDDSGEPFIICEDVDGAISGNDCFVFTLIQQPDPTVTTEVSYDIKVAYTGEVLKKIDTKYLPQTKWEDIINRPFGVTPTGTVLVEETTVDCNIEYAEGMYVGIIQTVGFIDGVSYTVYVNGSAINLTASTGENGEIGVGLLSYAIADNFNGSGVSAIVASEPLSVTYKIVVAEDVLQKIDSKYLPDDIGGSSLPEVTTSDVGKFLRVSSSGNWIAETIPNAEEVSF